MIDAVPNGFTRGARPPASSGILGPDGLPYRKDYGDFALPNVLGFSAILGSAYKTYYHQAFDEAYRHDRQDPLVMRQDAFLMGLLQERKLAVASEAWHLEIPDERDKHQVMVRDCLTKALEGVWGLRRFFWESLDAIWYGRMGQSCEWKWENIDGQRVLTLARFTPINGDKIGHKFDGTPYVLINAAISRDIPGAEYVYSTVQKGILIKGTWAEHVLIHHHHRVDADFFDADRAEAIHGVGIRSDLFWINWIRLEWQARISDFVDRVGLGLTIWYYEQGNNQSYLNVKKAAEEQSGKLNILLPCPPGKKPGEGTGVQRIETPAMGADLLNRIIEPLRKDIERYVVGQEASSSGEGSKGLGNEAGAEFQANTKFNITQFDAWLLADFMTGCSRAPGVVSIMKRWSFPWADFPVNFVFGAENPQAEKKLDGAKTLFDMRVPLKADEVRAAGGFSKPGPGDETVKAPDEQQPGATPGAPKPDGTVDNVLKGARGRAGDKRNWQFKSGPRGGKWDMNSVTGARRHHQDSRDGETVQYANPNQPRDADGTWTNPKTKKRRRLKRKIEALLKDAERLKDELKELAKLKEQHAREKEPAQYFDPNERRIPAGQPGGGEWTSDGGKAKELPSEKTRFYPPPSAPVDATKETRGQVQSTPPPTRPEASKSPSSAAERSPLHRSLETTRMRHAADLSSGANQAYLLGLDDGTKGIFKPLEGESDISPHGMTPKTAYLREVAASRIAEILGFQDLVPTTTFREQSGNGIGSMQQFVADAPEAATLPKDTRYDGLEDAARAAAFDYLLGNLDRHQGNWLVKDGKLALIDNGFSLPHHYSKDDLYNMEFWRHAVKNDLEIPDVATWKDKWSELEKELKSCGIEDEAIALTRQRFDNLIKARSAFFADLPGFFKGWTMRQIVDTYDKRSRAKADGVHLESI